MYTQVVPLNHVKGIFSNRASKKVYKKIKKNKKKILIYSIFKIDYLYSKKTMINKLQQVIQTTYIFL